MFKKPKQKKGERLNKQERQEYFDMFLINNYLFNIFNPKEVKRLKRKYRMK